MRKWQFKVLVYCGVLRVVSHNPWRVESFERWLL
jgi:hypothetical protein